MRELGIFWEEELLSELKGGGLGKATVRKQKNGISTVSQVKNLTTAEIGAIANSSD
jgi:hypothetical protein